MKKHWPNILTIVAFPVFILIIGPIRSIRIMQLGAHRVAAFRRVHGREPTEAEWQEIADQVGREIMHS